MSFKKKSPYSLFFILIGLLSLNLSTLTMKRKLRNDNNNEFELNKKKWNSIFFRLPFSINKENKQFYFTLVFTLRNYKFMDNAFYIPKDLIKKVLGITIELIEI